METSLRIYSTQETTPEMHDLRFRYVMHIMALKAAENCNSYREEAKMLDRADTLLVLTIQEEERFIQNNPDQANLLASMYRQWQTEATEA